MGTGLSASNALKRKSTNPTHCGREVRHKRNPFIDDEVDVDNSDADVDVSDGDSELETFSIDDSFVLKPFWILSRWPEPETLTKRITIYIQLTCGCTKDDYIINISENGRVLEVTVSWPSPMSDIYMMHKKWLDLPPVHPDHKTVNDAEILGFQESLRKLRKTNSDKLNSVIRIPLPFAVQKQYEAHPMGWRGTTHRGLYIRLRATDNAYGLTSNNKDFEIV